MEFRTVSDMRLSVLGMGSEGFEGVSPGTVRALVDAAIEGGINLFDLYNANPVTRRNLGLALKGRREQVYIEGHLCSAFAHNQYYRTRSMPVVRKSFEELLSLLDTDYVDIGMIHYVDSMEDFARVFSGEVIQYARELKSRGIIRHIGLSSHNPVVARKAVETGDVEVLLFSINPAYDMLPASEHVESLWAAASYAKPLNNMDPDREALYETCQRLGVGITVMKPFAGGDLLTDAGSPFSSGLTPHQLIHYALDRPGVKSVLGGYRTPAEIRMALSYFDASEAARDYSHILADAPRHNYSGKCMYCGHCAPCAVGIDVAMVNKLARLATAQGEIPETVREHYRTLEHHARECVGCGRCEKNCPFGVPIREHMRRAAELFGF